MAIPACDNAIGPDAYKPGDTIISKSKKSIYITNTDAEGRLLLMDAITYLAEKYTPKRIVSIATLTGTSTMFFGPHYMAIMGNDHELQEQLISAGKTVNEKLCPVPFDPIYDEYLKWDTADYVNAPEGVGGGTIIPGRLLYLVGLADFPEIPYLHIDGAQINEADPQKKYLDGPTGMGSRLLAEYLSQFRKK